jgi:hypothetical protein
MMERCAEAVHFKAICEPKFAEMYAALCHLLKEQCPELVIDGEVRSSLEGRSLRAHCTAEGDLSGTSAFNVPAEF